jgi:hypothetical protein
MLAPSHPFPPEPWRLRAEAWVSAWLLPPDAVPFSPPPGWRPATLGGRVGLGCAFVRYGPEGDLAYDELVAAVLIRRGLRLGVTIPWIWVDSPASAAGARELWAIPKSLAAFEGEPPTLVRGAGRRLASVLARAAVRLPGRWPARLTVVQARSGQAVETPVRIRTRAAWGEAAWRTRPPLPALAEEAPLFTLRLDDAQLVFGRAPATLG